MEPAVVIFILIVTFIILIVGVSIYSEWINSVIKNIIENHCESIKNLHFVNSKYAFIPIQNLEDEHNYDNRNFYDDISCEDYLIYQLQFRMDEAREIARSIKQNATLHEEYIKELKTYKEFGKYTTEIPKHIKKFYMKKLQKMEEVYFECNTYHPVVVFKWNICLNNVDMSGRILRRKQDCFLLQEVSDLANRMKQRKGQYYLDKDIWDAICRVERGKVSNKMRFSIYQRDGYRCRMCGVSDKFADLEIDHIYPVAKGGKSIYGNLQTLCKRCNKEKGATVSEYYGNNYSNNKRDWQNLGNMKRRK